MKNITPEIPHTTGKKYIFLAFGAAAFQPTLQFIYIMNKIKIK